MEQLINMTLEEKVELYKQLETDLKMVSRSHGVDKHLKPLLRNYKKIRFNEGRGHPSITKRGLGWCNGYIYKPRGEDYEMNLGPYFFSINRNMTWAGTSFSQVVKHNDCIPLQKTVHY